MEFLAAEFSKESGSTKSADQKDQNEPDNVDSTMLEVASVQGITGDVGMEQAIVVITDYESELKDKVYWIFYKLSFFY